MIPRPKADTDDLRTILALVQTMDKTYETGNQMRLVWKAERAKAMGALRRLEQAIG